jgi:hypothetical protein
MNIIQRPSLLSRAGLMIGLVTARKIDLPHLAKFLPSGVPVTELADTRRMEHPGVTVRELTDRTLDRTLALLGALEGVERVIVLNVWLVTAWHNVYHTSHTMPKTGTIGIVAIGRT